MAKRLDIRVEDDLYDELVRHAEAQDRSINWVAGKALRDYCAAATQTGIEEARRAPGEVYAGKGGGTARFVSNPDEERARHDASLGRADRPEEMGVVDEARRREVTPSFKGGKR